MITLYFILFAIIGLGILAFVLIVSGYMKHSRRQMRVRTNEKYRSEKFSAPTTSKLKPVISLTNDPVLAELGFSALDKPAAEPETEPKSAPVTAPETIVFYILAPAQRAFIGYELLQAVLAAGLRYGDMDIFHRYEPQISEEKSTILFSLASAVEPGIFDMANIGSVSCPGLSIFMIPAAVKDPIATFGLMVETAQQLADDLGGQLYNSQRQPLTMAMIEKYRAALLEKADLQQ